MTTVNEYLRELYQKGITCFDEMKYEQKSKATSLLLQDVPANEIHDYVMNYSSPLRVKIAMESLLIYPANVYNKEELSIIQDDFLNMILDGAISMAKMPINEIFAEIAFYPRPDETEEPDYDDEMMTNRRQYATF